MTNAEKFKEVFGFKPDTTACVVSDNMCAKAHEVSNINSCEECNLRNWFEKPYRSCFCEEDRK